MNPSSSGWIDKYIFILEKSNVNLCFNDEKKWYSHLHDCGFIYGYTVNAYIKDTFDDINLTKEELTKTVLLHALFSIYATHHQCSAINDDALKSIVEFYRHFIPKKDTLFQKTILQSKSSKALEQILHDRVENNKPLLRYPKNKMLTHALLFVDVLVYSHYLRHPKSIDTYFNHLEAAILKILASALEVKKNKTVYEDLLINIFQETELYNTNKNAISYEGLTTISEKYYALDLCCLALWSDHTIEMGEQLFLENLSQSFQLSKKEAHQRLEALKRFEQEHATTPSLFQYKHPVKHFYTQSTKIVKLLILRNKKRLLKELSQSKELLILLGKSTYRDLDSVEKQTVKEQLIEICKTIPSLTIFLLPGGSLLLPLLVKFIPQLLPSAFDDNRVPKKKS